ncbi:MAG: NADH-quinone oxidoreductase subunit C [Rhodocyclaceae bacterium]|nr:NADH-quinone oxidoreductase subunit C [Rhodocyclaceae bacterium]
MRFFDEPIEFDKQPGIGSPVWRGHADNGEALQAFAVAVHRTDGRLAALWGSDERLRSGGFRLHCVFGIDAGHAWLSLDLPADRPTYPDLAGIFPAANRMQRATRDLVGIAHEGGDQRPWLRHGAWPEDWFPLRHDAGEGTGFTNAPSDYDFVQVGGEGAHEIPVGPIHAGIIEPGHFRFSVIGERLLRLEQRLGYQHKGVEKLFVGKNIADGARLAGRISGDSTCACAWAYAMAAEAACGVSPPPRALMLRALMLERERVANHLGDLGALGNDAALAFGFSQFMRLKEDWLRLNGKLFGHRFMMDRIVPGGVALDLEAPGLSSIVEQCDGIGREVKELKKIYDEHAGLQDRFATTGAIDAALARELSLSGLAAAACSRCGALRGNVRVAAPAARDRRGAARRRTARRAAAAGRRAGPRRGRGLARRSGGRPAARRRGTPCPRASARSLLAGLAGAGTCGDEGHRSRLSAHQQVVQPFLQRSGFMTPHSPAPAPGRGSPQARFARKLRGALWVRRSRCSLRERAVRPWDGPAAGLLQSEIEP